MLDNLIYFKMSFMQCQSSCDVSAVFSVTWSISNCSNNISYQCWEYMNIVFWGNHIFFQDSLMNRKFNRTAFIGNRNLCNIVFTVIYDQLIAALLNESIHFLQRKKTLTPNFWKEVYIIVWKQRCGKWTGLLRKCETHRSTVVVFCSKLSMYMHVEFSWNINATLFILIFLKTHNATE